MDEFIGCILDKILFFFLGMCLNILIVAIVLETNLEKEKFLAFYFLFWFVLVFLVTFEKN
jgi:hypothetical protein